MKKPEILTNTRLQMNGLDLLASIPNTTKEVRAVFFDPQYRGILDKMNYGNEGKSRGKKRSKLEQMPEGVIKAFIREIHRVLPPSAHLFLWLDKFHLCNGDIHVWLGKTSSSLEVVDLLTWDKGRMGMGYRTRRQAEYLAILQKTPIRAKGIWNAHNIPDVIQEKIPPKSRKHPHQKPVGIQSRLIESVVPKGAMVVDPAAGSFSVMTAAKRVKRDFLGCDLEG